jgi:hypothetical protein
VDFLGNLGVESEGLYVSDTRVSSSVKALTRLQDFAGLQETKCIFWDRRLHLMLLYSAYRVERLEESRRGSK